MKYLLILFLSTIIIFSCNTKEANNNNSDKAAINLNDSMNQTEQAKITNNNSINTNQTEELTDYSLSYTDEEIIDLIKMGDLETIKKLIESKSLDVNYNLDIDEYSKSTPLIQAIEYKQTDIINYLLENNADVNLTLGYSTPLTEAMYDEELVRKLIDLGADINLPTELTGFTPLMASLHNIAIAELLIEKGADIEAKDDDGINALVYASTYNNEEMVKFLLEKGADANTVCEIENEHTDISSTPLMNAAYRGNTNIINMLLENGADINYTTDFGMTALMMAASFNQFEAAKVLLENNADTSVTDEYGRTALDLAKLEDYKDIVQLLEKYN
ncbi:ankyrin repeat domain-containing protein [Brachyspira hampsonii]|uniref:ankyrin repeat domain-containing protein n=1 Tax=Brachyspira hampsonii TaxID=1287055 RepID=UPI001CA478AD|nr:ankyrin repeat domain-containing protein [Brachyspira hampsonii]MBW5390752.1 ankyrin repeat domain-containing protein [Brachyspira hampsonii]